ncbi:hypothetical protein IHE45_12G019200 [Dioscorea alata]|uniref:Uncharacterized protein n=1 Tax=Dioscorea alata TaxID=55571 RepID=A0ACB7V0X9_DIOAL|nr:hypothetical protein IHE45_12G019200 [Dioscorea alata]
MVTLSNSHMVTLHSLPFTATSQHSDLESVDHLFIHCHFTIGIWSHFAQILHIPRFPSSLREHWEIWLHNLQPASWLSWDLLARAITWSIWLTINDCIFNCKLPSLRLSIYNIGLTFVSWISASPPEKRQKLEPTAEAMRRVIHFTSTPTGDEPDQETQGPDQTVG